MYNLIEYSDAYSKTSGIFMQCYRNEPTLGDNLILQQTRIVINSNLKSK